MLQFAKAPRLARIGLVAAILSVGGALAGCGNASFDKGFNDAFDKKVHDSCVETATPRVGADTAEKYCTCVVGQIDKLTVQQKMELNQHPETLTAAANYCNAQDGATEAPSTNGTEAPSTNGQ